MQIPPAVRSSYRRGGIWKARRDVLLAIRSGTRPHRTVAVRSSALIVFLSLVSGPPITMIRQNAHTAKMICSMCSLMAAASVASVLLSAE